MARELKYKLHEPVGGRSHSSAVGPTSRRWAESSEEAAYWAEGLPRVLRRNPPSIERRRGTRYARYAPPLWPRAPSLCPSRPLCCSSRLVAPSAGLWPRWSLPRNAARPTPTVPSSNSSRVVQLGVGPNGSSSGGRRSTLMFVAVIYLLYQ